MSRFSNVKMGRFIVLSLSSGEDILLSVNNVLAKEDIDNAVFLAGAGDIINCHTHYADDRLKMEVPVIIENQPMELCGVSGFRELKQDHRITHLHGVTYDGTLTRTIHIHEGCTVLHTFHIGIAEIIDTGTESDNGRSL